MGTYIESGMGTTEKIMFGGVIAAMVLLFITLTQPVWNADHLISQYTNDCKKRGGVLIVDHGLFGDTYSCESWLGR